MTRIPHISLFALKNRYFHLYHYNQYSGGHKMKECNTFMLLLLACDLLTQPGNDVDENNFGEKSHKIWFAKSNLYKDYYNFSLLLKFMQPGNFMHKTARIVNEK